MAFRYQLRDSTGADVGDAEYSYEPDVGDTILASGNRQMLVTAIVPIERVEEHVTRPLHGILEVNPL